MQMDTRKGAVGKLFPSDPSLFSRQILHVNLSFFYKETPRYKADIAEFVCDLPMMQQELVYEVVHLS
jgi:hypothetical protein